MKFNASEIRIIQMLRGSPLIRSVQALADANNKTLGFMPAKAIEEYAARGDIFVALYKNNIAGYIMIRRPKTKRHVIIVHFCIGEEYRGKGLAEIMFSDLKQRTKINTGIGLKCRQDFIEANAMWKRLGFIPLGEEPGRSKKPPTILVHWWYGNEQKDYPTLFDMLPQHKRIAVIDFNVFLDLSEKRNHDSEVLENDWIAAEIELAVTPEIYDEFKRGQSMQQRNKHAQQAKNLRQLSNSEEVRNAHRVAYTAIRKLYPTEISDQDESDINHLAWSIADPDVSFFVTRDDAILNKRHLIYDRFGLSILHPVDVAIQVDELSRMDEYRNARVSGTQITTRRIQSGEIETLVDRFANRLLKEKPKELLSILRTLLTKPQENICNITLDASGSPSLLFVISYRASGVIEFPIIRTASAEGNAQILRSQLQSIILKEAKNGYPVAYVTDPRLQQGVADALKDCNFKSLGQKWVKLSFANAEPHNQIHQRLNTTLEKHRELEAVFRLEALVLSTSPDALTVNSFAEIERIFFPAKILDSGIPALTIPIRSEWANQWFDHRLAEQTLFGANIGRAFSPEGVYYSAASAPKINVPARILWYVTKDINLLGTAAIRACSRLEEIVVGRPKDLFARFQHLGIYEWKDVLKTAQQDIDKQITAYRFSQTELFDQPIALKEWEKVTHELIGKGIMVQSPAQVTTEIFAEIYKRGTARPTR